MFVTVKLRALVAKNFKLIIIPKIISPILSLTILFFIFNWLFDKVNIIDPQPRKIPISINSIKPAAKPDQERSRPKPVLQNSIKDQPKRTSIKGYGAATKQNIPVIRIYYASNIILEYMRSLASRESLFLLDHPPAKLWPAMIPSTIQ